jgi:hypothetical protein
VATQQLHMKVTRTVAGELGGTSFHSTRASLGLKLHPQQHHHHSAVVLVVLAYEQRNQ